ncbi:MAG: ribosomal L7Ae/L30e/S12e/Gadd45 family protein [Oscillospiraceae bacterium]|jgi:ribosomal protein L7Ae-like RNA K-turn-binding protein|nr:ribosomal L7Ae/L30e/S12e/Gadd45 family protein [Oscillospiraceae bacterium]
MTTFPDETAKAKFLNLLGMARRAQRLAPGHDAAKKALRGKAAKVVFLTADAAERLKEEFAGLCVEEKVTLYHTELTMPEMKLAIDIPTAVFAVTERGFARTLQTFLIQP